MRAFRFLVCSKELEFQNQSQIDSENKKYSDCLGKIYRSFHILQLMDHVSTLWSMVLVILKARIISFVFHIWKNYELTISRFWPTNWELLAKSKDETEKNVLCFTALTIIFNSITSHKHPWCKSFNCQLCCFVFSTSK